MDDTERLIFGNAYSMALSAVWKLVMTPDEIVQAHTRAAQIADRTIILVRNQSAAYRGRPSGSQLPPIS